MLGGAPEAHAACHEGSTEAVDPFAPVKKGALPPYSSSKREILCGASETGFLIPSHLITAVHKLPEARRTIGNERPRFV